MNEKLEELRKEMAENVAELGSKRLTERGVGSLAAFRSVLNRIESMLAARKPDEQWHFFTFWTNPGQKTSGLTAAEVEAALRARPDELEAIDRESAIWRINHDRLCFQGSSGWVNASPDTVRASEPFTLRRIEKEQSASVTLRPEDGPTKLEAGVRYTLRKDGAEEVGTFLQVPATLDVRHAAVPPHADSPEISTTPRELLSHKWQRIYNGFVHCVHCEVLQSPDNQRELCPARNLSKASTSSEDVSKKTENVDTGELSELPEALANRFDEYPLGPVDLAYLKNFARRLLSESAKQAREIAREEIAAAKIESKQRTWFPSERLRLVPGGDK